MRAVLMAAVVAVGVGEAAWSQGFSLTAPNGIEPQMAAIIAGGTGMVGNVAGLAMACALRDETWAGKAQAYADRIAVQATRGQRNPEQVRWWATGMFFYGYVAGRQEMQTYGRAACEKLRASGKLDAVDEWVRGR